MKRKLPASYSSSIVSKPGQRTTPGVTVTRLPTRRVLFRAAAGAAALLGTASRLTQAQTKMSQGAAGYQDRPNGNQRCATCSHFEQPNKCQLITGSISPQGWCRLFAPTSGS